jgi:hypothetical protein
LLAVPAEQSFFEDCGSRGGAAFFFLVFVSENLSETPEIVAELPVCG